jgi:hypothetical protein
MIRADPSPTSEETPNMRRILLVVALILSIWTPPVSAEEPVDWEFVTRLRAEAFHRSQVMETITHLTDEIGPRLSGSPGMKAANEWTRDQLEEWGLENAVVEPWGEFGRGWSFSRASAHLLTPRAMPLVIVPIAWTPGTDGPVQGEIVRVTIEDEEDLEEYRGKLAGKILLLDKPREHDTGEEPALSRRSREDLDALKVFEIPDGEREGWRDGAKKRWEVGKLTRQFFVDEGALAYVHISSRNNGLVRVGGAGSREIDEDPGISGVQMAAEQYNYLTRLADAETPAEVEIDVTAQFHDDDLMGYNTIAEIPGTDLAHEVVMLGGHLDSWHAGTGATDNAAGTAVMMEVVRLLKVLDVKPRRTIRIALWGAEEQGLWGSRKYVEANFADRPAPEDPEQLELPTWLQEQTWPIRPKPAHDDFSVYFNMDNGSGKVRGIYTQENLAVAPIFEAWLEPFHDIGADTVTHRNTGGTDHLAFDAVGLPGFQFIQDRLAYSTLTHHTAVDVLDLIKREDLIQASTVIASFVYHAAMRDEKLPREPMPRKPEE